MNIGKRQEERTDLERGLLMVSGHPLFGNLYGNLIFKKEKQMGKYTAAYVCRNGEIYINGDFDLNPRQWAFVVAHCCLHLAFGHFDAEKIPGYEHRDSQGKVVRKNLFDAFLWNEACDIYICRFLEDIKFGEPLFSETAQLPGNLKDEQDIYEYLLSANVSKTEQMYGTAAKSQMDMHGLDKPIIHKKKQVNPYSERFAKMLTYSVFHAVSDAGNGKNRGVYRGSSFQIWYAAKWFTDHYPLLGALASAFEIVDNYGICQQKNVRVAAVNAGERKIYVNPACGYTSEEWIFVLAHEYLHAGLEHDRRSRGRDPYLWNIACDFVVNEWLQEMQVGSMPEDGLLYDENLKGLSAESVYDLLVSDMKKYAKMQTFRGNGMGDIITEKEKASFEQENNYTTLDEFCRNALQQGLEYHQTYGRGYIPAGLIEEIRALAMPAIPWNVELARWLDHFIEPLEKHRTYARPSRRQASMPDIPRPSYIKQEVREDSRTFGVVIDTSGSMSTKMLGQALGAVASYAVSREVPFVRVVFCDAAAYDAGYLAPEDIAGYVEVKGRGGTVLQPGVDLLEKAQDFPKDGPVLIITDGMIERSMQIHRQHAFLLSQGKKLPFVSKGRIFHME